MSAAGVYEEERRAEGELPPFLQAVSSHVRYEEHGIAPDTTRRGARGTQFRALYFLFSLDGSADPDEWWRAELCVGAAVLARAQDSLGTAGFEQALFAIGMCAVCWLLMEHPRRRVRLAASLVRRMEQRSGGIDRWQFEFWDRTMRGTLAEFQFLNRLPFFPELIVEGGVATPSPTAAPTASTPPPPNAPTDGVLVPLGGGKDCLTMIELLREAMKQHATPALEQAPGQGQGQGHEQRDAEDQRLKQGAATCASRRAAVHHDVTLFHLSDSPREWEQNWRLAALHRASGVQRCVRMVFMPPRPSKQNEQPAPVAGSAEPPAAVPTIEGLVEGTPPWAALVCFSATLGAAGTGCHYIAVGNERSANEGNGVDWLGEHVNHQYDKSFAWERDANRYVRTYIAHELSSTAMSHVGANDVARNGSTDKARKRKKRSPRKKIAQGRDLQRRGAKKSMWYFSGLMHWWEVQIAERFSRPDVVDRYLSLFISCNTPVFPHLLGSSRWCSTCPKCAFVFLLLSARLRPERVWSVFGENLFEVHGILPVFRALLALPDPDDDEGTVVIKPLECVGTPAEARFSLLLAGDRYVEARDTVTSMGTFAGESSLATSPLPRFLALLLKELHAAGVQGAAEAQLRASFMHDFNHEHGIPAWLLPGQ